MPLSYPLHQRTLANGLRVVVSPDHSVPTVTVNLWVGVGSRHEVPGRTGFAHLFEHLMFQGSRNVKSGEHFEALMAVGARLNATTWFDRTNYFETVPTGALELALWLEADRHGHLLDAVNQENLDNQRDVVKEEKRQRYDNQPYGFALIDLYAATFPPDHPYHHPTIGSMEDLDAASVEDVHAFFAEHYGPDNTVLTLCGDVTAERGFELAERYFGELPATGRPRRPHLPQLPPMSEQPRIVRRGGVPNDRVYLSFRLPADDPHASPSEFEACAFALDILGGLASSRLTTRLVRQEQSALSAHSSAWGFVDGASLGFIALDVAPGHDPAQVEAATLQELTRLLEDGPSQDEIETVLAQAERSMLSSLAAQEERADLISQAALLHNDPDLINTHLDRIATMTPAQIQSAARRWLQPSSVAVVSYLTDEADVEADGQTVGEADAPGARTTTESEVAS